jgi:hypothetical protein
MRSMVEGAAAVGASVEAVAPSTTLLRRVVPLPRFAGQDERARRENDFVCIGGARSPLPAARGGIAISCKVGHPDPKHGIGKGFIVSGAQRPPFLEGVQLRETNPAYQIAHRREASIFQCEPRLIEASHPDFLR